MKYNEIPNLIGTFLEHDGGNDEDVLLIFADHTKVTGQRKI